MGLDFYHGQGSPFSWRVWLALECKQIPYNLKVLSFQNNETTKPEFVAINPRHQVPTIVDDGFALWESMVILEYLDERFPGALRLYPGDAKRRALIRRLAREAEEYLYKEGISVIVDEYFWKDDAAPDPQKVEAARKRVREELEYFARELKAPFLDGAEPTAADFVMAPLLGYVSRISFRKPDSKLEELVPAPLAEYHRRLKALPYYDKTFPPHWR